MKDGLYSVKFATPLGAGSGVVVKIGERLYGGDTAFAWDGNLTSANDALTGQLNVQKHDPSMPSVFGPLSNFTLDFSGSGDDANATLKATSPNAPGVTMTVAMHLLKAA